MLQFIYLLLVVNLSPSANWQTYKDSLNRYTIQYPVEWSVTHVDNAVGFLRPANADSDDFDENVNVILQNLSQHPLTLKQYTDISKAQYINAYGQAAIVSLKDTSLAGNPAEVGIFVMKTQGHTLKLKQCWFIKNNIAYLLTYTAKPEKYSTYLGTAMKIFGSFKVYN